MALRAVREKVERDHLYGEILSRENAGYKQVQGWFAYHPMIHPTDPDGSERPSLP
jgi:hypothetical protein